MPNEKIHNLHRKQKTITIQALNNLGDATFYMLRNIKYFAPYFKDRGLVAVYKNVLRLPQISSSTDSNTEKNIELESLLFFQNPEKTLPKFLQIHSTPTISHSSISDTSTHPISMRRYAKNDGKQTLFEWGFDTHRARSIVEIYPDIKDNYNTSYYILKFSPSNGVISLVDTPNCNESSEYRSSVDTPNRNKSSEYRSFFAKPHHNKSSEDTSQHLNKPSIRNAIRIAFKTPDRNKLLKACVRNHCIDRLLLKSSPKGYFCNLKLDMAIKEECEYMENMAKSLLLPICTELSDAYKTARLPESIKGKIIGNPFYKDHEDKNLQFITLEQTINIINNMIKDAEAKCRECINLYKEIYPLLNTERTHHKNCTILSDPPQSSASKSQPNNSISSKIDQATRSAVGDIDTKQITTVR